MLFTVIVGIRGQDMQGGEGGIWIRAICFLYFFHMFYMFFVYLSIC